MSWVLISLRPRQRRPRQSPFSSERARHVAGPPTYRPFQDRISHRSRADGGSDGCRPRHRGGSGRRAGFTAVRTIVGGEGALVNIIRQRVSAPVNMNFFCHTPVDADPKREAQWKQRLAPYYKEPGLDPAAPINAANRAPVAPPMRALLSELHPETLTSQFS